MLYLRVVKRRLSGAPDDPDAVHRIAVDLCRRSRLPEALALLETTAALNPSHAELWNDLGVARSLSADPAAARSCFETAVRLDPRNGSYVSNLGACLLACKDFRPAASVLRRAFSLTANPDLRLPLATALVNSWDLRAAIGHLRAAARQEESAGAATAHGGIADVQIRTGKPGAAVESLRRSLACEPHAGRHSTLLRLIHYDIRASREEIFREHRLWADRYCPPAAGPPTRSRRHRRLRIGYVSGIFVGHTTQLGAIVRHHDRARFDVFCFSDENPIPAPACHWIPTGALSNEQLAASIRDHDIDILVECDGHFRHGIRLPIFAGRNAPVQLALPLYPGSPGVPGVDFRVTDAVVDPPDADSCYAERQIRLPLYLPWEPGPLRPPAPIRRGGPIVFGSFSGAAKINAAVIACWAALLRRVPRSRLLLQHYFDRHGRATVNPAVRRHFQTAFARHGVDPSRVDLRGGLPRPEQMLLYHSVDIALDPFPYNGTLTTLSALSMGVPVVTLAGVTSSGRVGKSILSAAGLESLVAADVDDYCRIAAALADDPAARSRYRRRVRDAFRSAAWNPATYATALEHAYRQVWESRKE